MLRNKYKEPAKEFTKWLNTFLLDLAYRDHYGTYDERKAKLDSALVINKFTKLVFSEEFKKPRCLEGGGSYNYELELGKDMYNEIMKEEDGDA